MFLPFLPRSFSGKNTKKGEKRRKGGEANPLEPEYENIIKGREGQAGIIKAGRKEAEGGARI